MPQGLVSIVVIFKDAERFLGEAVDSVWAQSYTEWELLLVDDGSTDGSTACARRWAEQHPERVHYFEHPEHANRGMSASRNLGLRHARGEYLAFLDADDMWLPGKLVEQVALLRAWPDAAMVYGLSQWWYSWTGQAADQKRDFVHPLGVPVDTLIKPPRLLHAFFFDQTAAIPSPSSILIRRSIAEQVGGFEEAFATLYEDQAFYAKIGLAAPTLASSACWDRYRQHDDSCVATAERTGEAYSARLRFMKWLASYFREQHVRDAALWRALALERWRCEPGLRLLLDARLLGHSLVRALRAEAEIIAVRVLPTTVRALLRACTTGRPPPGWVRLGHLGRVTPVSRDFGFDRGLPVDRYYIERFLEAHADDIKGRVLEIADDTYTRRFGGNRVTEVQVVHVTGAERGATLVADLTDAPQIASASFDCVILTQTLQFIYDVPAALSTIHRILRPGGVVLATVPGISQISRYDMQRWGHYWSFTTLSAQRLFETVFRRQYISVEAYGNVLAAVGFLHGLATHEIGARALDQTDQDYQLIISIRATTE